MNRNKKMILKPITACFALCMLSFFNSASANVSFSGTLVEPPPCTINGGKTITIDFEKVAVNKVDGVNYRKPVNYTITCDAGAPGWVMMLSLKGTAAGFEPAAVQSSVANLGIKVFQNGAPFVINTRMVINPSKPPILEAVPIKKNSSTLSGGSFTAAATLLAEYL